jgi:hypothetical protein
LLVHNDCTPEMTSIRISAIPRFIQRLIDSKIINRVKELRASLTRKYKTSGNFGYAEANILGLNRNEFYAHSSINKDTFTGELPSRVPDISLEPTNPVFDALKVNPDNVIDGTDAYSRIWYSEYKILNDIANRLGDNIDAFGL